MVVTVFFLTGFGTCMWVTNGIKKTFEAKCLLFVLIASDSLYFFCITPKNVRNFAVLSLHSHIFSLTANVGGDVDMTWYFLANNSFDQLSVVLLSVCFTYIKHLLLFVFYHKLVGKHKKTEFNPWDLSSAVQCRMTSGLQFTTVFNF